MAVTKSMCPVTHHLSDNWGFSWRGSTPEDNKLDFILMSSDADFTKTMGTQLLEERDINIYQYPGDSTAILLNETAVKKKRLKNPVGEIIRDDSRKRWVVVGVIKDFVIDNPYDHINPLIIYGPGSWFNVLHYKLNPSNSVAENLKRAGQVFKKYNPEYPFEYHFVDEEYARKFDDTQRTDVLAALFIALPVAWYAMHQWLSHFAYNIGIEWWVFFITGMLILGITLITVSFQAIKAAIANPVKSLRIE